MSIESVGTFPNPRRPRVVWVSTAILLGALALGSLGLKASGLTNAESFRGRPQSVAGQAVLDHSFPGGSGEPVVVTGSRVPTPLNEALADVTVIDRAALDQAGQSSLRDLLGQQPGVQ